MESDIEPPDSQARCDNRILEQAVAVLTCETQSNMVELVAWSWGEESYEARAVDGSVRFRRDCSGRLPQMVVEAVTGRNPLGVQDATAFSPLRAELEGKFPDRTQNSYPYAYEHIAQVFDHKCAPDLIAVHAGAHCYDTYIGNHGSPAVVQARAPFIASGPGIAKLGMVDEHCRLIDVAPTLLALMGQPTGDGIGPSGKYQESGLHLHRQDGQVIERIFDSSSKPPKRILVFLLDGCNANVLYDAVNQGIVPSIANLLSNGIALRYGAIATLPTVTLANHTTLVTGCFPAHHGVLHNAWWDRANQEQIITESIGTWHTSMQWLAPGVETIHQALKRTNPGAVTYSINEPADTGANWSTFEMFRQGRQMEIMPDLAGPFPLAHPEVADFSPHTRFGVVAETMALNHGIALWSGELYGHKMPLPDLCWINMPLTDSVFHDTGPHSPLGRMSLAETDARIGQILEAVDGAGALDETAVFIVADHGMEESDPNLNGSWNGALSDAGINFRDEAHGFIYLNP